MRISAIRFTLLVKEKHKALVKKMIKDKKFTMHHEMSVELQKAADMLDFNRILDEYDYESKE